MECRLVWWKPVPLVWRLWVTKVHAPPQTALTQDSSAIAVILTKVGHFFHPCDHMTSRWRRTRPVKASRFSFYALKTLWVLHHCSCFQKAQLQTAVFEGQAFYILPKFSSIYRQAEDPQHLVDVQSDPHSFIHFICLAFSTVSELVFLTEALI